MTGTTTGKRIKFRVGDKSVAYATNVIQREEISEVSRKFISFHVENPRIKGEKIGYNDFRKMFIDKVPFEIEVLDKKTGKTVEKITNCFCTSMSFGISESGTEHIGMVFSKGE